MVKIADWEHAKFEHEQHPQGFSEGVGTYGYIAPECMHLESPAADYHSRASDMWSVGIIVLELMLSVRLAGKPEEAEELARLVVQQHHDAAAITGDGRTPGPKRRKTMQAYDHLTVLLVDYVAEKGCNLFPSCQSVFTCSSWHTWLILLFRSLNQTFCGDSLPRSANALPVAAAAGVVCSAARPRRRQPPVCCSSAGLPLLHRCLVSQNYTAPPRSDLATSSPD